MNRLLIQYLKCPICSGMLCWDIHVTHNDDIIEASVYCNRCRTEYCIHFGIACFLFSRDELLNNFKSSKDLSCDLNSFDTYTYTHDTQNAVEECISIVNEALMNTPSGSLVLDFAAGHGNLFSRIQKRVDLTYIVNDIDFNSLLHIKRLSHDNNIDINYFAYDAGHSPFNDKSVSVAMSLLGLQHIMNYKACLIDLKRIIAKEMLHISSFCHKQDKINLFVLKSKKLVDMWLEDKFSKTLSDYNIAYDVLYSTKAFAKGIRKEKDISYVGSDRFPIVDTTIYYTVAKLK